MKKPTLSVIIISYNQEKYIEEAIDNVLNQKVNFDFELLLADDCSKDNTLNIMKEYEKKYPNIIKVLERKENLGATKNIVDAYKQSKGKYITVLEGDDYWCDENKIQKQIDFLEENPEYIGVSHLQQGRDLNGNIIGDFPKNIKEDCDIEIEDFINGKVYSYTSTVSKNLYFDAHHIQNVEYLLNLNRIVGDLQMCTYLLSIGKVRVFAESMMVYRMRRKKTETNYNSTHSFTEIKMANLDIFEFP